MSQEVGPDHNSSGQVAEDEMNWEAYASHYDTMCELNPSYYHNIDMLLQRYPTWNLPDEPRICDLGAGTGNYIAALGKRLPGARFTHVDFDAGMISAAQEKYKSLGIDNVEFVHQKCQAVEFPSQSFDLILCINALYAMSPQRDVLTKVRTWLVPHGKLFLIDFGRKQKTLDWATYMFRESLKQNRLRQYTRALFQAREVVKQNRQTSRGQKTGRYWLHSTDEFGQLIEECGFRLDELTRCYRDYADLAVCSA